MKKVLVSFLLLSFFLSTEAQKNPIQEYSCNVIRAKTTHISLIPLCYFQFNRFQVNNSGKWLPAGMFGDNLKKYLNEKSGAHEAMRRYKNMRIAGISQIWGGIGCMITGTVIIANAEFDRTPVIGPVLLFGGWATYYSGLIFYQGLSMKHYKNALLKQATYCNYQQAYFQKDQPSYFQIGSSSYHPGIALSYHF